MSDPNARRSTSIWWALLVIPVALAIGWVMSHSKSPVSETKVAAAGSETEAQPGEPVASNWTSYQDALAESEATGKPVLLDFNADWCPPCQRMKHEVFESAGPFAEIGSSVIPVSIVDRTRETGSNPDETEKLQGRFGIQAFPTLVVYSPRTGRSEKSVGYGGADYTASWVADAAQRVR